MNKNLRSRFSDAPWMEQVEKESVVVGGAGGIGSWLSLLLSRIGVELTVYDFDKIEEHNIGGQWFKYQDIHSTKVEALQKNIADFAQQDIQASNNKITENTLVTSHCFSAFDNMKARKDLFTAWKKASKNDPNAIFIDGRLAAEQLEIYVIKNTPEDIAFYESPDILFDDSEVAEEACTLKQTSHYAAMIASFMVNFYTNHLTNVVEGEDVRELPRVWKYKGVLVMPELEEREVNV